jgi:hypothetical protein
VVPAPPVGRILLVLLLVLGARSAAPEVVIEPPTTTSTATSSTTAAGFPACAVPGSACGSCGPVGQCLEHVDSSPPARVCVDGGFCVQVDCSADAQCPAGQVCATLGGLSACCAPCR